MQVLLPDFVFHQPQSVGTPFKNSRKLVPIKQKRLAESKKHPKFEFSFPNNGPILENNQFLIKNRSIYISRSNSKMLNEIITQKHFMTLDLFNQNQTEHKHESPIHSRNSNRSRKSCALMTKKKYKQKQKQRQRNFSLKLNRKSAPTIPFLITQGYNYSPLCLLNQQMPEMPAQRSAFRRPCTNGFPRKKVNSAFVKQQYRPWSPSKGDSICQEINN